MLFEVTAVVSAPVLDALRVHHVQQSKPGWGNSLVRLEKPVAWHFQVRQPDHAVHCGASFASQIGARIRPAISTIPRQWHFFKCFGFAGAVAIPVAVAKHQDRLFLARKIHPDGARVRPLSRRIGMTVHQKLGRQFRYAFVDHGRCHFLGKKIPHRLFAPNCAASPLVKWDVQAARDAQAKSLAVLNRSGEQAQRLRFDNLH